LLFIIEDEEESIDSCC